VSTIPRRRRLNALLAIVAIVAPAAMVALLMWATPLTTSGAGAEKADVSAGAVPAVIHDDAGNVHPN
jgi:hypothetical protein